MFTYYYWLLRCNNYHDSIDHWRACLAQIWRYTYPLYQWLDVFMICQYYNLLCYDSASSDRNTWIVYWLCCADLILTYLTNFFTCKSKCQFVNILHWYKVCHPQISLFYFILISLDLAINWYWYDSMNFLKIFQHKIINSKREEFIT